MEEQVSIIIPIIVALLTGGFIILFLENQHVGANVIERYHFVMQPFMHRLSNYFKFLSSAKVYFSIKSGTSKNKTVYDFNNLMDKLGHMAFPCIMSGQDYPVSHFSACQIQEYSEDINKVWYYLDRNKSNIINDCFYDSNKAEMVEHTLTRYFLISMMDKYYHWILLVMYLEPFMWKYINR